MIEDISVKKHAYNISVYFLAQEIFTDRTQRLQIIQVDKTGYGIFLVVHF
jgi:hypothetical protein